MNKKPINKIKKSLILILLALSGILFANSSLYRDFKIHELLNHVFNVQTRISDIDEKNLYKVNKVVDGDTIVVENAGENIKIRLLGINAPESVHRDESKNTKEGKQASKYLRNLLEGKSVYLEYDEEPKDKYGRDLCYVYLEDKMTMVNKLLVSEGMAKVVKIKPNVKYYEELKALEKEAKQNKKGFWKTDFFK